MSPSCSRPQRRTFNTRPLSLAFLALSLLAGYAFLSHKARDGQPSGSDVLATRDLDILSKNRECRLVHSAKNKCKFVRKYCTDENAGLIPYLTLYYCDLGNVQPIAFVFLVSWTGMLFTTIGIAASDFFSVNLSTMACIMGLSESLAGVTFLAFGNGSPDVFSTFAAMGSNSSSMAVGELIGAAGFITAVIAGSMALVREFKVSKRTYVRDICFFIVAATFTMVILLDGNLNKWECGFMIGFYVFYVVTVVGWHWYSTSRKRKRVREAVSRTSFYGSTGLLGDDLEPYRDNEEDEERTAGNSRNRNDAADISTLENGSTADDEDDDDDDGRGHRSRVHVAAEMTSSMRVMRLRGRRSTTTITPIRPSLVGALEFRSVLNSLQKESNVRLRPISRGHVRSHSVNYIETSLQPVIPETREPANAQSLTGPESRPGVLRGRAFSSGDVPQAHNNLIDNTIQGSSSIAPPHVQDSRARSPSPPAPFKVNGKLAPPPGPVRPPSPQLQLQTTVQSQPTSELSSPAVSPFPTFVDSPMLMSPNIPSLPSPTIDPDSGFFSVDAQSVLSSPRPVKWWPYRFLPPPHVLTSTLFPTLQQWSDKSIWDKFVSIISAPSIFLLVITLPVVEADSCDEDSDSDIVDILENSSTRRVAPAPAALVETEAAVGQETEWQRYRRSTRSHGTHLSDTSQPLLISIDPPGATHASSTAVLDPSQRSQTAKQVAPAGTEVSDLGELATWNRWLVALQMVAGPLFVVFIVWANMQDEFEDPGKILFRFILGDVLFSVILLAFLFLTTRADERPKYYYILSFLGFIISIAWISTVAGEVVGVLKAIGVILGISEAILGLTIFAVGNSLGDLVADVTVARLGYPVMALSACFGGPMLNILLGIGLGGLFYNNGLHIEVGPTLIVSAISLLVTLVALLVVVPMNKWMMTRKIGWGLIGLWSVSTIFNLVIEVSGIWGDVE